MHQQVKACMSCGHVVAVLTQKGHWKATGSVGYQSVDHKYRVVVVCSACGTLAIVFEIEVPYGV